MTSLPDVQLVLRPGIVEFGWGQPDQALLPVARLGQAAQQALAQAGGDALSYGAEQGPGRLLTEIAAWLRRTEGLVLPLDQLVVTGGVSQALDLLCTILTRPGDAILVQAPTYHLALRIFRDHGLDLVPVPGDDAGLRPDALVEAVATLRRVGRAPRFLYLVPTFANPSSLTLDADRRAAIVAFAQEAGLLVLEDDVYHDLWYDAPPPASLYALAPAGPVVRLGSFSKVLAPGLRLGWLAASPEIAQRFTGSGMVDSGGGVNHFTAHVVAAYLAHGWLDEHLEVLREAYQGRRAALLAALEKELPPGCRWTTPGGGIFVWLRLPPGCDGRALLPAAEAAGVSYLPGTQFYAGGGGEPFCRLAFSLLAPEEMARGIARLATVLGASA